MNPSLPTEEEIFRIARAINTPDERLSYLKQVCGVDSQLFERVTALLNATAEDESFLENPPEGMAPTVASRPTTEKPGDVIGPFKLLQQIGEGGFGVVYMAEQTRPVSRRVALKVIKPGMDTKEVIARFEAERQALAMMDHPNIAKVLDAGATEGGRPYFVMKLVNGLPITEYCDQGHLSAAERLALFVPVCDAVQHAHQKGIIHRDIKPSNIIVANYDGRPVPKVIDFGVAKATNQLLTDKTLFTQLGQVIGTLEYMSPEQARRNQLDVDTRTDIYSLGVVLYELLVGETPFDRHRLRAAAYEEILRIIREEEPPLPSLKLNSSQALPSIAANRHVDPAKLARLVRGELDWITLRALEKDRSRRYQTAAEFASDIKRHLNGERVEACPPSKLYRARKFASKYRSWLMAFSAAAVLLVSVSVYTSALASQAMTAKGRIKEALDKAESALKSVSYEKEMKELALHSALVAEKKALSATQEAKLRAEKLRKLLYIADMNNAAHAWQDSNLPMVEQLLRQQVPTEGQEDLRQLEWYVFFQEWQRSLKSQSIPFASVVKSAAYSPDSSKLAVVAGVDEATVYVLDSATKKSISQFRLDRKGEKWPNEFVRFSPDGRSLAYKLTPTSVRIHNLADGTFSDLTSGEPGINCGEFSNDGKMFAFGDQSGAVSVWELDNASAPVSIKHRDSPICEIAFSPVSLQVAITCLPNPVQPDNTACKEVVLWDLNSEREGIVFKHDSVLRSVAFSPNGRELVCGGSCLKTYDIQRGTAELLSEEDCENLTFSSDGNYLAASNDRLISIWDFAGASPQLVSYNRGHTAYVRSLCFSSNGGTLLSASLDSTIRIWDVSEIGASKRSHQFSKISRVKMCDDGSSTLVKEFESPQLAIWNPIESTLRWFENDDGYACFDSFGTTLAAGKKRGIVQFFDIESGKQTNSIDLGGNTWIQSLEFTSDGKKLVIVKGLREIQIWNTVSLKMERTITGSGWNIYTALSPDNSLIALADNRRGEVAIWNLGTGSKEAVLDVNRGCGMLSVVFSPDGRSLAVGRQFLPVQIWNLESPDEEPRLLPFNSMAVSFDPSGRTLHISDKTSSSLVFWDIENSRSRGFVKIEAGLVSDISVSNDGKTLAIGNSAGIAQQLRAASAEDVSKIGW